MSALDEHSLKFGEIKRGELDQRHRDAMLNLILAWGSLDNALGMLLSSALGKPLEEGAEKFGKLPSSAKLQRVRKVLKVTPRGDKAARTLKKLKQQLEKHSKVRNRIAHSHCIGAYADNPEYIIFLPFEKYADGELTCELTSVEEIESARKWGCNMRMLVLQMEEALSKP